MLWLALLPAAHADAVLLAGGEAVVVPTLSQEITVAVRGQVAVTTVTTRFAERSSAGLTYAFDLPAQATATDLVLRVDGAELPATLAAGEDPELPADMDPARAEALVTYLGGNPLRASLGAVPPGAALEVRLEYVELLPYALGDVTWTFPALPFEEEGPVTRTVALDLDPGRRIEAIRADGLQVVRGEDHAVVTASGTAGRDLPLAVSWTLAQADVGLQVYSYRPEHNPFVDEDSGYFVLLVEPPREAPATTDKYFTYVVDRSGSMGVEKMEAAKAGAHTAIGALREDDSFNLISFDDVVDLFRARPAAVTEPNREAAHAFVDTLSARGGTNIHDALLAALDAPSASSPPTAAMGCVCIPPPRARRDATRPQVILFLTDGLASGSRAEILEDVAAANTGEASIWSVAIGADADLPFLQALSQQNRGQVAHLVDPETLVADLDQLVWQLENPVLLHPELGFAGGGTRDVLPGELPDLFLGNQLVVVGRYEAPGAVDVALSGTVDGAARAWDFAADLPARAEADPFVARIWAKVTVDHLLARVAEEGESEALIDTITELGLAYRLDTPYTRFGAGGPTTGSPSFSSGSAACGCAMRDGRLPPALLAAVGLLLRHRRRR